MWKYLADPKLIETYREEFISGYCPKEIVSLLAELSKKPYASNLCAVTSLGHLRLTTATSWQEGEKHDCIWIGQRYDAGKLAITISYVEKNCRKSTSDQRCTPEEAADCVDLYVSRLIASEQNRM
jgi:hypothetical protein